jgi:5'-nucleotidase
MKKTLTLFAALILAFSSATGQDLVILHTNDTHSQIEPLSSGNYKGLGGVVRREKYINQVRAENKNVILLDAGDFSQGTPYFTLFRGDVEIELMNALKVDVATFVNHEFDNGQEELARRIKMASFPVVNANYDLKGTPLDGLVAPYAIIERGGKRIGVIGLSVRLAGLVSPNRLGNMKYEHPYKIVNRLARRLRNREKCDLVILLSHCGYNGGKEQNPTDEMIAKNTEGVDIIIGGHSHTFIKKPMLVESKTGKKVMIVQAGAKGEEVGRIDIWF